MNRAPILLIILSLVSFSCQGNGPVEETRFLMDTVVRISVYDQDLSPGRVHTAIDKAFKRMEQIEDLTSIYIDSNDVSRIIQNAGLKFTPVSSDVSQLLRSSIEVSENTMGAFDITVGVIKRLWQFDSDTPLVPDEALLKLNLHNVNYKEIQVMGNMAYLGMGGMVIDLGGIAKGYIIDQGIAVLLEEGVKVGIVEAGGDMGIFGSHPHRKKWRIGIRHPRKSQEEIIGVLETDACSIATSGDYERCFFHNGIRYHHILDPRSGLPAEDCVSVTIVTESALLADAYATAVFVLGHEKGLELIERMPSVEGVIFYEEYGQLKRVVSKALLNKIHFQ